MLINQTNLTDEQKNNLELFLDTNNIPYFTKEKQGDHLYQKFIKSEYSSATVEMNEYNSVILNLMALAACGSNASPFTFTAEVVELAGINNDNFKEFTSYTLGWDNEVADKGMKTIETALNSFLYFDADPISSNSEFITENDYENFVRLF